MRVASAALLLAFLFPATARAGIDGVGAAAGDARSVSANPAAAVGGGEAGPELWTSLATILAQLHYHRARYIGTDPQNDPDRTFPAETRFLYGALPSIDLRGDVSRRFGWGFSLTVPTGSHVDLPADGPGRYQAISGTSFAVYAAPVAAWRATPNLRVGAGPVLVYGQLTFKKRVDLAPSLAEIFPSDPPPYPETGALEGQFWVNAAKGISGAATAGAIWDPDPRWRLGLSGITPSRLTVRGRSHLTPSLDFAVTSEGDFAYTRTLPPFVNAGARFRARPDLDLSLEAQWAGWSSAKRGHITIRNSEIQGTNADVQSLLSTLGISGSQLVSEILDQDRPSVTGDQDALAVVLSADRHGKRVRGRADAGFLQSTVPQRYVTTANIDFDKLVLGGSVELAPRARTRWRTELGVWQYLLLRHVVRGSPFRSDAPNASGMALPTGDGRYDIVYTRVVLSSIWQL